MATHHLQLPLREADVAKLRIGDMVYYSGEAFTCRSMLHRHVFDKGNPLPFPTEARNLLIHVGPVIRERDGKWKLISFMPTSSLRFEKWGARSIETWGLRAILGKTTMGAETAAAMQKHKCIHTSPVCVSPNKWIDAIEIQCVHLRDELGWIEAPWHLKLNDLGPFLVDMDCHGNSYFDLRDREIEENRRRVYAEQGIPEDFQFTKLY